jgi:hypothetical protein
MNGHKKCVGGIHILHSRSQHATGTIPNTVYVKYATNNNLQHNYIMYQTLLHNLGGNVYQNFWKN